MAILTGPAISDSVKSGHIHIEPFIEDHVGPNSYDLRLAPELLVYSVQQEMLQITGGPEGNELEWVSRNQPLDVRKENPTTSVHIPDDGYVLKPGILYLGTTMEYAGSDIYVPCIEGRSSMARLGISPHVSAGFGDHGFKGKWTLEITVAHPVRVYAGMRVCQVYFHEMKGEEMRYDRRKGSKYAESHGVEASKSHRDFV